MQGTNLEVQIWFMDLRVKLMKLLPGATSPVAYISSKGFAFGCIMDLCARDIMLLITLKDRTMSVYVAFVGVCIPLLMYISGISRGSFKLTKR